MEQGSRKNCGIMSDVEFSDDVRAYSTRRGRSPRTTSQSAAQGRRSLADINHPLALACLLAYECQEHDPTVLAAALLHDTVEDTGTTFEENLRRVFGSQVAAIIREVTDDKSLPKAERKRLQIERAAHASRGAKLVKLADKSAPAGPDSFSAS